MSAEDKSLESACEQPGPPAAPASPAATDRRPRGRPRKDGTRKKPRSRGKSALEDEDSMDGLGAAEPENSADKDPKDLQPAEDGAQTETASVAQLTPPLQRSLSEESERSTVSVGIEAKTSEQLCAFCYCGERSLLGQGELKQFSPTTGYILPWTNPSQSGDTEDHGGACKIPGRSGRQRTQKKAKSPQSSVVCTSVSTQTDEPTFKFWDELGQVGLPADFNVQALFESTGHCWAHHRCAEWSPGVSPCEDGGLVNVDKAVVSGSRERCAYCKHLGATIKCCEETCSQTYHYPCAAGAGAFQDLACLSLLCPEHIDQALERSKDDANCAVCDSSGDLLDQLFCTTCGQHYHGICLDIAVTPLKRAGWQCPDCKICQNCKHSGDDNKMLVCDTCDKGYHTFCLQPVMDSVPTNGWKCKNCRICVECGTRTSNLWHLNCLICDGCFQLHGNTLCQLCDKPCQLDLHKDTLHCQMCKRWIHLDCEKCSETDVDDHLKEEFVCTLCKQHLEVEDDAGGGCIVMDYAESSHVCTGEMDVDTGEKNTFQDEALNHDKIVPDDATIGINEGTPPHADEGDSEGDVVQSADPEEDMDTSHPASVHLVREISLESAGSEDGASQPLHLLEEPNEHLPLAGTSPIKDQNEPQATAPALGGSAKATTPPLAETKGNPCSRLEEHFVCDRAFEHVSLKKDEAFSSDAADLLEMETTPTSETFTASSSPMGDKILKSPLTLDSPVTSVDTSKTSVSSSPAVSVDFHSSSDMFQSHTPAHSFSTAMSTTFISVTPKIGMGKPAITKRKFSPGRPRSRQGAWITNNTVSPPSWSPDGSEGWDIFKSRPLLGNPLWSIKVGRGSGFPAKRRPRGSGLSGRGGRGRAKLKAAYGNYILPGVTTVDVSSYREEEETSMHNTVVLFSTSDKFTLHQDMCVVCGSFGQGAEGRLLACCQCGQCYHPYCVSIKITKVILRKGWRCLECTVCEACGKATDPGRLLLCDDCDISYHTYCLDPPLQTVPKGGWKCKWCVSCTNCKAITPGLRCEWQNNYTQCAPCASLSTCPVCSLNYLEGDLILQCRQCDRWSHGSCQNLNSEVEVEIAADGGFDCAMCKPFGSPPREDCESPIDAQIVPKTRDPDPLKTFTQDGVCLTESGLSQLQSLTITVARRKRSKPKLKLKIINQNSVAVLQTPPDPQSEHSRDGEMDDSREADLMECDVKSDSSPEREPLDDDIKSVETIDMKKRKRKPYRPGIGGFMVRQRSRTGQGKAKRSLCRKDSSGSVSELLPGREESWSELVPEINADESVPGCDGTDKIKKRYRKKKNKLEETFPAYLQEAFFGRNLLDTSKQNKTSMENFSEDSAQPLFKVNANSSFLDPSSDPLLSSAAPLTPSKRNEGGCRPPVSLADLSEVLNTDDDLLGILSDDLAKATHQSGLDMSTMSDDSSSLPQTSVTQHSSRPLSEDQLDGILSPELDKMVTDGAILGKLYKIPELEGKDVEDLFTAVLSPVATHPSSMPQPLPPSAPSHPHHPHTPLLPLHNQGDGLFSRMPLNGIMPRNAHLQHNPLVPGRGLGTFSPLNQLPYTDNRDKNLLYHGMTNDPGSTWNSQPPIMESEGDTMSNAQRSTLKWEKEEALGEMATVAPVLYTNVNFPNLKDEFPDWSTRVKQIAKLWRKASSQERAPYVQKARDNRAALRINKVQMSNDSLKRQPQDVIDQSSRIDSDLFKDPLRQRESEHEQEWKYRQQMRQKSKQQAKIEATQKLEQVKNEQQQQQQQQQFGSQHHLSQSGSDTPNSGAQSPLTPQQSSGSISPLQQSYSKDGFPKHSLPGTPSYSDDVFLKPQAPPPTPTRLQLQDPLQLSQPHSPQMFSPGSSRSTSPVDPYAKMVGTPRPPPTGQGYMRRNSGSPMDICPSRLFISSDGADNRQSPVGDPCSSPSGMDSHRSLMTSEPFSKPVTLMRMPPNTDLLGDGSLVPGNGDPFTKFSPRSEKLQRQPALPSKMTDPYSRPPLTPTHGVAEGSPAPFKTPMCPPQSPQDSYSSMPATSRRLSADPYDRPVMTPRPENVPHDVYSQTAPMGCSGLNDSFAHPPRFMRQHSDPTSQPTFQPRPTAQDPYAQPPGTPRPVTNPYLQSPTAQRPVDPYLQQPSTPRPTAQPYDPYSQQPSTPRPNMGDVFVQPSLSKRHHDIFAQSSGVPRPVMDPCSQQPRVPRPLSLDPYSQPPGTPRPGPSDSYSQAPGTPKQILSDPYSQPPGTPRPVPSDPYSQPPGTPRPVPSDLYSQPPGMPRPVPSDPYSQPPGTQRLVTSEPYSQPPGTPRPVPSDPYSQPPGTPRPVPSDPYSQPPGTPRPVPSDPYSQPPGTPRPIPPDPYSQPPGTPRPVINDPYLHPSRMPRPVLSDPYAQPPRTPMPGIPDHLNRPPVVRTGLTLNQNAFLQAAPNRGPPLQSHFMRPSDPNLQTLRPLGPGSMDGFAHSSGGPVHDPYDQPPRTPRMPVVDAFGDGHDIAEQRSLSEDHFSMPSSVPPSPQDQQFSNLQPGSVLGVPDAQNSLAETEEKIRQRLKLREHLLRQQQQKNAVRQEKAAMDPQQMTQGGHPAQWQQDNLHRSPEMFNRPPPPYPGSIRPPLGPKGSPRFAVFPQEQQASFPGNAQFNRPPFTGDMSNMGMRPPPGHRFAYSLGGPVMGHERYLGPPLPMQVPGASQQMRRDMAIELTRPSNNSQMANSVGLPPHFPHQGMQVQQHNISGQAYIELRHRPPDGRPRILYGPSPNLMDPASHHPRHGGYFIRPGFQGQRLMDPTRVPHPGLPNQMQMTPNLEHFMQSQQGQMNADHQSVLLMRGMGQPLNNDFFLLAPFSTMDSNEEASGLPIGNPSSSGMEDKLDQDDPSEKDLDVKDLVSDEVKDLDDFENINLDPDDGKGDELDGLDNLDTNDPHLDDLLRSGKFDIIAYTDPEHDLEDKKDLFNDDLELGETIDDKLDLQCPNEDAKVQEEPEIKAALPLMNSPNQATGLPRQIKTELISPNSADQSVSEIQCDRNVEASSAQQHGEVTSVSPGNGERSGTVEQLCIPNPNVAEDPSQASVQDALSSSVLRESSPVLTDLLSNDKPANSEVEALGSPSGAMPPALPDSLAVTQTAAATSGQILDHSLNPNLEARLNHDFSQGSPTNPDFVTGQQGGHNFDDVEQSSQAMQLANQQCPGGLSGAQQGMLSQNRERPLLLEEQPLLLQDLLDQERQEQQQQRQMQAMIRQRSETCFPNIDFDAITDPIMKAKMVALKGINKVMAQNNMGMPQMVMTRFPFITPQITGAQPVEGPNIVQQAIAPDGGIPPQMIRPNPLNFGHGFVNDSQKQQYEEWLKETQQLLQIQQKFLEEQIGVHRKSKKALSAKQRTAKKAGREFPEEDAEQLKNVTEQQSMVQKQLEQIRKQQKEHTELIEEYRNKQHTQFSVTPLVPGAPPPQALMPGVPPPSLNQQSFPVPQPLHSGGPLLPGQTRMPAIPNWQPPNAPTASVPMNAPRMQHPVNADAPGPAGPNANPNAPPRVEFDDNNPFSETFQERERKERLREQQERQRIQLMQEVDRQRALQRLEMEKHGLGGADLDSRSLQQMPFFPSELPVDFLQSPQPQGSPPAAPFNQTPERRPLDQSPFKSEAIPGETQLQAVKQSPENTSGPEFTPTQPRPSFMSSVPSSSPAADDTSSSSQNFSAISALSYQGPSQSLIQVYSEIIPEEKGKKKRTRKKKKEEDAESVMSPSTPRSDTTAPLTPSVSDASTPVVGIPNDITFQEEHAADLIRSSTPKFSGKTSLDLEDALLPAGAKQRLFEEPGPGQDEGPCPTKDVLKIHHIKMEQTEDHQTPEHSEDKTSHSVRLKNEDDKSSSHNALSAEVPPHTASGPSGNELLKHLLKNKKQPLLMHQKSEERMRPEEDCSVEMKLPDRPGQLNTLHVSETKGPQAGFKANQSVLQRADFEMDKKKPRNKRIQKTVEKATPRSKKRKKEEEQKPSIYNSETFTHIKQLSLLPLIEPIVGMNFAQFLPYGTGTISAGSRLLGTFGAASLEGVSDYYSQLIFKQNNLSNPPTPPASLPPTPPPVACQKLVNGYATTEELAGKAAILGGHVTKALGPKPFQLPFRSQEDLLARAMTQGPKSVDVPASLPTPPHNNQEELRVQDHCDARDSPDSFVPSSSPESVVGMEISRYPDLSLVKEEPPDPAPSPIIPMLPSSTGKGSEARDFGMKREPQSVFFGSQFVQVPNGPKSGLISVAITLHPTAAENINGVMAAFADLLQVRMPTSYEVSGASEAPSMILMNGHRINSNVDYRTMSLLRARQGSIPPARMIGSYGMRPQNLPFMPNSNGVPAYKHHNPRVRDCPVRKDSWCCHCKVVVLGIGVRKSLKDLSFLKQEFLQSPGRVEGDMVFCSNNCFLLFSAAQTKHTENKDRSVTPPSFKEAQVKSCHQYSNNTSTIDVHCLPLLQEKSSPPMSPPISFPPATFETAKVEAKPDELKVTVKLKPRPRAIHGLMDDSRHPGKKWKGMKWKKWNIQFVIPKMPFRTQCEGNIDDFLRRLGTSLRPDPLPKDFRKCCFCHEDGDGVTDGPARLLNLDLDLWVHLNCALWSTEVYETQAGALINVELALRRGLQMKCVFCHKTGATSGCHRLRCTSIYHFTCAIKAQCMFFKDKTMLCPMHKPKGAHEQELTYFAVFRRVYVQRDEVRQIASIVQRGERDHTFRVGSLIFHAIGQLLPHQMQDFHSVSALFPVGYEASRLYWSIRYANKRCRYLCSIEEKDGLPLFVIRVIEPGHEDLLLIDSTPKGVWDKILEPVANCRKDSEILRLFPIYLKGEDLFGLTVSAVTRIAESLPGVEACENYTFRFGRNPLMELPLAINPSGSARSEPKMSSHVKRFVLRPHTLNSTSTSKSFQSTVTGELNAPYSKQFVHSKSSQYRKMKTEWKSNVYLARSRIQGLGLYAARDIEKHTMVIEYIGTIIRNEVANRKEKLYESQNRGVYMFRMDNEHVIDATLTGGPARYINHSCAPNCVAEMVTFEKGHKIIISSSRRVQKGEELCYDYKFDFEDDQHKIPCHCRAVNCRKWMN